MIVQGKSKETKDENVTLDPTQKHELLNPVTKSVDPFFKWMALKTARIHDILDSQTQTAPSRKNPNEHEKEVDKSIKQEEEFRKGLMLIEQRVKSVMHALFDSKISKNNGRYSIYHDNAIREYIYTADERAKLEFIKEVPIHVWNKLLRRFAREHDSDLVAMEISWADDDAEDDVAELKLDVDIRPFTKRNET
jgi:hypothetical protein